MAQAETTKTQTETTETAKKKPKKIAKPKIAKPKIAKTKRGPEIDTEQIKTMLQGYSASDIGALDPVEQKVLKLRAAGKTLHVVGKACKFTGENARLIQRRALAKLSKAEKN